MPSFAERDGLGLLATESDLDPQRPVTFAVIWSVVKYLAAIFRRPIFFNVPAGQLCFGVVQFTADLPTVCADEEMFVLAGD